MCASLRSLGAGGRPHSLVAGQELCICYGAMASTRVFISLGFLPPEVLPPQRKPRWALW